MPDEVHYETYLLWYEEARWVLHGSGALPILELAYHQWYATLEKTDPPAARAILDAWEERNRARQTSHEAGVASHAREESSGRGSASRVNSSSATAGHAY